MIGDNFFRSQKKVPVVLRVFLSVSYSVTESRVFQSANLKTISYEQNVVANLKKASVVDSLTFTVCYNIVSLVFC